MISECLAQKKSFGVVRAKEEGVAEIGCTAEIITVANKYPDGRMDIVTEGRERFEVMQVDQERYSCRLTCFIFAMNPARHRPKTSRSDEITMGNHAPRGLEPPPRRNPKIRSFPFTGRTPSP